MAASRERLTALVADVRRRRPLVDHLVRMQEHYSAVRAGQHAGAVTYFAFLSFFPILALAFFVVGWVAKVYAGAVTDLEDVLNSVMPGLVGDEAGQIQISQIEDAVATLGIIGLVVLLYSGLAWLSAMRAALIVVFEVPVKEQPSFVFGKLRDLLTLVLIGVILLVSVAVAGLVGGFAADLLRWLEIGTEYDLLVKVLTAVLGFAANMLLFFTLFALLAEPPTPRRSLWQGAIVGAVAFEVLRQLSTVLLRATQGSPAFQAFGIALILLVWINYFSRVVLYSAAFAHTTRAARALRAPVPTAPVQGPPSPAVPEPADRPAWVAPYVAGAVSTVGLMAVVRKLGRRQS